MNPDDDDDYLVYYHQPMSFSGSVDSYSGAQPPSWGAVRPLVGSKTSLPIICTINPYSGLNNNSYSGVQPPSYGAVRPLVASQTSSCGTANYDYYSNYGQPPSLNDVRGPQTSSSSVNIANHQNIISDDDDAELFYDFNSLYDFMSGGDEEELANDDSSTTRPRLVWTPQLHKRFVDAVCQRASRNVTRSLEIQE